MISHIATSTLLLSAKARFTHSLTSAVELAMKTKSPKHITFAENLLKIKRAAPDTHLESLTRYKRYLCCYSRSHDNSIREDKYQCLANELNRVKEIRLFLDGSPPAENTLKSSTDALRREVNTHLAQAYTNTPKVNTLRASIYAISQKVGQKKSAVNVESFTHLTTAIQAMIDAGKPLGDITHRVIEFKVHHRLNSQP